MGLLVPYGMTLIQAWVGIQAPVQPQTADGHSKLYASLMP